MPADPFASLTEGNDAAPTEPTHVDMSTVRPVGASMPGTDTPPAAGEQVRCTCGCGCTNPTSMALADAASPRGAMRAATMRCEPCRTPGHYMPALDLDEQARLTAQADREMRVAKHAAAVTQWRERVPAKFQHANVSDDPFILDRVERFREGVPSGFILTGAYGTGKTWMCFGFLNLLVESDLVHPSHILFGRENDLLGTMSMGGFDEREAARRRIMDPKYRIVYIDDAGQGNFRNQRDAHTIWHEFVDNMWSTDRVILVSTNYALTAPPSDAPGYHPSQFEQWVGEAAFDRLRAVSGFAAETLGGGDDANIRRLNALKIEKQWRGTHPPADQPS